jgi:hypothetical protein
MGFEKFAVPLEKNYEQETKAKSRFKSCRYMYMVFDRRDISSISQTKVFNYYYLRLGLLHLISPWPPYLFLVVPILSTQS